MVFEENKAELSDDSDENLCISLCDHTIQSHGGLRASELGLHNKSYISSKDIQENHLLDEISSKTEAKDQIVEKEIVPSLDQNGYHFFLAFSILILLHKYYWLALKRKFAYEPYFDHDLLQIFNTYGLCFNPTCR